MTRIQLLGLVMALALSYGPASADDAAIARGKYLFDAADCGGCHGGDRDGSPPSGGLALSTPFGVYHAANITPDKVHGIGTWSVTDFHDALRFGIGPGGKQLFPVFPFTSFTQMTDADIADLYAYIQSLPAIDKAVQPHEAPAPFGWRWPVRIWRALFFTAGPFRPDPAKSDDWNRGNYLVHAVAHCEECHSPRNALGAVDHGRAFSGNIGGPDGQNAPNITSDEPSGIGKWTIEEIENLLKTGQTPDFDAVASGMKAVVRGTAKLTQADQHAIAVYLKTVAPIYTPPVPKPK
jgi:mono/diheme cytochrome c family protein